MNRMQIFNPNPNWRPEFSCRIQCLACAPERNRLFLINGLFGLAAQGQLPVKGGRLLAERSDHGVDGRGQTARQIVVALELLAAAEHRRRQELALLRLGALVGAEEAHTLARQLHLCNY